MIKFKIKLSIFKNYNLFTTPINFLINGYFPSRSNKEKSFEYLTKAKGTSNVLWSVNLIVSLKPGKYANTSVFPFLSPFMKYL